MAARNALPESALAVILIVVLVDIGLELIVVRRDVASLVVLQALPQQ